MTELRLFGCDPKLKDGDYSSQVRCTCLTAANLHAIIKDGKVVFVGCPVCKQESIIEITPDGEIGFFPMGVRIL